MQLYLYEKRKSGVSRSLINTTEKSKLLISKSPVAVLLTIPIIFSPKTIGGFSHYEYQQLAAEPSRLRPKTITSAILSNIGSI